MPGVTVFNWLLRSYRKYTVVRAGFEALVAYDERKFENGTWPSFGSEF